MPITRDPVGRIARRRREDAPGRPGNIEHALVELASNLPQRDPENRFLENARRALGLFR